MSADTNRDDFVKLILPASVFMVILLVNFLQQEIPSLPTRIQYVPDAVIAGLTAIVIARLIVMRGLAIVPLRYWLVFLAFVYVVASGTILNGVSPDVTFAGIRFYFKYVPLFLLPFAYEYSEKDIRRLYLLLGAFALIQIPVAFRQRFVTFTDVYTAGTGDVITGTLSLSTSLSVFLVGAIVIMAAFYLDKRITLKAAIPLALLFLLPATINETKATPLALGVGALAVLFARRKAINARQLAFVSVAGCLMLSLFVVVYDQMYASKLAGASGIMDFMSDKERLDGYAFKGLEADRFALSRGNDKMVAEPYRLIDQNTWIGKFDSLKMPFDVLPTRDGTRLAFGLGIGSVSSNFGSGGQYTYLKDELGATMTTTTQLIWETGLLGAFLGFALLLLVARDSLSLSRAAAPWGTVAAGWFGASAIVLATLVYTNYIVLPEITCLVAFFSGLVVAKLRSQQRASRVSPRPEITLGVRSYAASLRPTSR